MRDIFLEKTSLNLGREQVKFRPLPRKTLAGYEVWTERKMRGIRDFRSICKKVKVVS